MYARVSTLEGPPELMDESLRLAREVVLPQGRLMEGFKGMIALGDRHSGRTLGITFWESEEAMHTSEEAAKRLREESAKAGGDTIASVERYEVEEKNYAQSSTGDAHHSERKIGRSVCLVCRHW